MKIQMYADYRKGDNKLGTIRLSRIVGNKPIEYTLQLFENYLITLKKTKFPTMQSAIAYASSYGFLTNLWNIKETE